jgi:hypothetical protein
MSSIVGAHHRRHPRNNPNSDCRAQGDRQQVVVR